MALSVFGPLPKRCVRCGATGQRSSSSTAGGSVRTTTLPQTKAKPQSTPAQPTRSTGALGAWPSSAPASATSTSQAERQERQLQARQQQARQTLVSVDLDPESYDLELFHYLPWWLQPQAVVGAGVVFFIGSCILDNEPTYKTAFFAAAPVALCYAILLWGLPRSFKSFAVEYLQAHPEAATSGSGSLTGSSAAKSSGAATEASKQQRGGARAAKERT